MGELALVAAETLSLPELKTRATARALTMLDRAREHAGPGLFRGTSGIGYTLLRVLAPDRFPCILLWR